MQTLNVREPYGYAITHGLKNSEYRGWKTDYRGPLLIHTSDYVGGKQDRYEGARIPADEVFFGAIVGACYLESIEFSEEDREYAWHLRSPIIFPHPFLHPAMRQLFDTPIAKVLEHNSPAEIGWLKDWIGHA